jgi:V8-like Glu-specific endopeptidase
MSACTPSAPPKSAEDAKPGPYVPPEQPRPPIEDPSQPNGAPTLFQKIVNDSEVDCAVASECPANVGLVVLKMGVGKDLGFGQCSGTLIGKDTILTNSHCVPDEVKNFTEHCSDRIAFVLPKAQAGKKKLATCKKVLFASDISKGNLDPDYALIQLNEELTDTPSVVSTKGFQEGQSVVAFTSDPDSEVKIKGMIRKKQCEAVQGTIVSTKFTHPYSYTVALFSDTCGVIGGNSGSGVFNQQGQVIGVISHGRRVESAEEAESTGFKLPKSKKFGVAANLACLNLSSINVSPAPECKDALASQRDIFEELVAPEKREALFMKAIGETVTKSPGMFIYNVSGSALTPAGNEISKAVVLKTPECIKPLAAWPKTAGAPVAKVKEFSVFDPVETAALILLFDEYLRPELGYKLDQIYSREYKFTVDPMSKSEVVVNAILLSTVTINTPWCSADQLKEPFILAE